VARMVEERIAYKVLMEKPKETDHTEVQGVDGIMRSEWILGRLAGGVGVDGIRLAQYTDLWRAVMTAMMSLRVLAPRIYLFIYLLIIYRRFFSHSDYIASN
jgi:hypothetical protein